MKTENKQESKIEWAYSKVAYILDVEQVIWSTCEAVKREDIREPVKLVDAVLNGDVKKWDKVTRRGIQGLFRVLRNQCGVDAAKLAKAAKLYN